MAKRKRSTKRPALARPAVPTLADVVIRWQEGERPVAIPGAVLARLAFYHSKRHPYSWRTPPTAELRGKPMMRGLSVLMFPDAGSPTAERHADERFFISEALADLVAELEADEDYSLETLKAMTVHIAPGAGLRSAL